MARAIMRAIPLFLFLFIAAVQPLRAQGPPSPAVPVVVAPLEETSVSLKLDLVGTSGAERVSNVAAQVEGLVSEVGFQAGDMVKKGDVLVRLDQTTMALSLQAAQAGLAGARVNLEEARADLARSAALRTAKTISVQSYEKDLFRVRSLEQAVAQAEAETARLAERLRRMTVRAPFAGYITAKHTEMGQWLNPGAPVATLTDLSTIKVRVPLPERYLSELKPGDPAMVTFDALANRAFTGEVTAVIPEADEKSRNLPMEVSLPNPGGTIKAGLLARVNLAGNERKVLLAPKDALVLDRGQATMFVLENDEVFPVTVSTGEAHDRQVEVFGEIRPGQMVVIQGNERLRPGQKVRVMNPTDSSTRPAQ